MSTRALAGCVALAAAVQLNGPACATDTVDLRVGCVLASNSGQGIDQRLVPLQARFDRLFRYTSYALVKEKRERVHFGARMGFDVPGGRYLLVIPKEQDKDGRLTLKVMLLEGSRAIVDTAVSMRNRSVFLVAGPHNDEGALILSIGADVGGQ